MSDELSVKIADLVQLSSSETVEYILRILRETSHIDQEKISAHVLGLIRQPKVRNVMEHIFTTWYNDDSPRDIKELISIIASAHQVKLRLEQKHDIDLVWTGPQATNSNMRRIDEALIEMISIAQHEIIVVSFAVYKAIHIMNALKDALNRGVSVSLYLETARSSGGKMSFDTIASLQDTIRHRSKIYIWPLGNRVMSDDGSYGALHAKLACVDRRHLLISSANITGHAMELNMEFGVLINDLELGKKVSKHLGDLVDQNIFTLYQEV